MVRGGGIRLKKLLLFWSDFSRLNKVQFLR